MVELPKVYKERVVRARVDHKCCECSKVIPKGSSYILIKGIWDKPATYKMCSRCIKVRDLALKRYPPYYPEEGPALGMLRDWISNQRDRVLR